jgi:hypothetical protein
MTSFEAGFIKYARECGLSDDKTAHILKRAMDYPGAGGMFHTLPEEEEEQNSPEDLEMLTQLLKQELIDKQMSGETRTIKM